MIERVPTVRVLLLFCSFIARNVENQFESLRHHLRGARFPATYHSYLAWTLFYSILTFLVTMTVLVVGSLIYFRPGLIEDIGAIPLMIGVTFPSLVLGYVVYRARVHYPQYIATERAREIELSMANVTNFLLALTRAGVSTSVAIEMIGRHTDVLGEAAKEFDFAHRDMEYFGADVVSALSDLSETTPLEELSDFINGFLRALTGRGDANLFLEEQMEELFEEAKLEQEDFLASLGVLAEVYVAVFVAFPIFALIILIVMGFVGSPGIIVGIRVVVYGVVPLTAIGFLVLLDIYMTNPLAGAGEHVTLETTDVYDQSLEKIPVDETRSGENDPQHQTLTRYQRKQAIVGFIGSPLQMLRRDPLYALYLGVILGAGYFALKTGLGVIAPTLPLVAEVPVDGSLLDIVMAVDNAFVEALIIVLFTYGLFYELRARYLAGIERELPDFLSDLSSRHQIGMSLSESIFSLRDRDFGQLSLEIERMARDFRMNANAEDVLKRFSNRVRSPIVTRVVVLLAAANETADRLGPVIEALSSRAELTRQLQRERNVEMSLYVIIIYISFLVFLVILTVLHDVFLPQIPQGGIGDGLIGVEDFDPVAYQTIFYHMSIVQGFFSGLVGGKMSEGSVSSGVKHALVMVVLSYLLFVVVLPTVSISI